MASSIVNYIYKIVPGDLTIPITASGNLLPGYIIPVSDLDQASRFIHMSTASQIPNTLKYFFPSSTSSKGSVYILRMPYEPLEKKGIVRWESPDAKICGPRHGEGMFPHIYDGLKLNLTSAEVESVKMLASEFGEEGWERALAKVYGENWLV